MTASAVVVGWKADGDLDLRPSLDILFVRLTNPARDVQLDGLPLNVVPIVMRTDLVTVQLLNGNKVSITRQQVPVLLNFAITDYGAQGQNRPRNAVDLRNCANYKAFYVALSRSVTSAGLIILSDFSPNIDKIQGGIEGWARQEYRELEVLGEITKLKHEGRLPKSIEGHRRNVVIRQYQVWAGLNNAPKNIHKAITWSAKSPMKQLLPVIDSAWEILVDDRKATGSEKVSKKKAFIERVYVPALGSTSIVRKRTIDDDGASHPSKRAKPGADSMPVLPVGFKQDDENFSCAYDTMFNILHSIWNTQDSTWKKLFRKLNAPMRVLSDSLQRHKAGRVPLVAVRNQVQTVLNTADVTMFPRGASECYINNLALCLSSSKADLQRTTTTCVSCGFATQSEALATYFIDCNSAICRSTSECVIQHFKSMVPAGCLRCHANASRVLRYDETPDFLMLALSMQNANVSLHVSVKHIVSNRILHLRGVIYFADSHFTARVVTVDHNVLFYDGAQNNGTPTFDGKLMTIDQKDWTSRNGTVAVMAIYSK